MGVKKSIRKEPLVTPPPELKLVGAGAEIPEVYKKIILALEKTSTHAIARAFREAFSKTGPLPPVGNYKNAPGVGVSGYVYGRHYSLCRDPTSIRQAKSCALFEDDRPIFLFTFTV